MGEVLLSTRRMNRIIDIGPDWVQAQAGVTLLGSSQSEHVLVDAVAVVVLLLMLADLARMHFLDG